MKKLFLIAAFAGFSTIAHAQYYGGSNYGSDSYNPPPTYSPPPSYGTPHDTYVAPVYRLSYNNQPPVYHTDTPQDEYYRTQSHVNTYSGSTYSGSGY